MNKDTLKYVYIWTSHKIKAGGAVACYIQVCIYIYT